MKLLVFYSYRLLDVFDDKERIEKNQCSISCPADLKQSEFKDFVYKNYYDKIFDLEKDCCGSNELLNLNIDCVKLLVEL